MPGYVTVPRLEADLLGDERETTQTHRGAWLWLFDKAAWRERVDRFGRFTIRLRRGEIAVSYRFLARAWNWSHGRVQRWLKLLADRGKVTLRTDCGVVVIALGGYRESNPESPKRPAAAVERAVDDQLPSQSRESTKLKESTDGGLVRFAPKHMQRRPTATKDGRKEYRRTLAFKFAKARFAGTRLAAAMNGLLGLDDRGEQAWFDDLDAQIRREGWRDDGALA